MSAQSDISRAGLLALSNALARGAATLRATAAQLARVLGEDEIPAALRLFESLGDRGMNPEQVAITLQLLAEERRRAEEARAQLVWSDHDLRGARDTAVVAHELFREAQSSVLVSTFNVGHKHKEGEPPGHPLLAPLAARMVAVPALVVRVFLNIKRFGDAGNTADQVARWARWFRRDLWPWDRVPEVYYDPRSLEGEGDACLHAKCIVVDDARAFVTSANLTESAHERNIEAGVLLRDPVFARDLRLHFEALVSRGLVRPVRFE